MNYYEILGVSADASDQQIKEAYRREAMKWHPDRHDGAAAKLEADRRFKDIALAYRTLRDPAARADYDRELAEKLQQEHTARHQEQARQEKAQQERAYAQSAQRQANRESPKADFADTGPQFEEETLSGDDANQMFFEQMLDLAFELAGRRFSEVHISKALIALGCPVSMANAVAGIAARRGRGSSKPQTGMEREAPAIQNFDDASWDELEPYYVAAVMGTHAQARLSETQYNAVKVKREERVNFFWGVGAIAVVLGFGVGFLGKAKGSDVSAIVIGVLVFLLLMAILSKNVFLGPDQKSFHHEHKKRYYLDAFKVLHMEKHGSPTVSNFNWSAAWFNVLWLGYRRQFWPAIGFLMLYGAIGIVLAVWESGAYIAWNTPAALVVSGVIGLCGNRLYFKHIQSKVRNAIHGSTQKQAFFNLSKKGGANQFGWILPLLLATVLGAPIAAIENEREFERNRTAQEARTAHLATEHAAKEERRLADEQKANAEARYEFQSKLKDIEARYPELNPDSASYNQAAMDWVVEQKNMYDKAGGRSPAVSLQQAVTDYSVALQRYRQQSRQAEYSLNSKPSPSPANSSRNQTTDDNAGAVICQTWPSACR